MRLDVCVVSHGTEGFLLDLLVSLRARLPAESVGAVHVWDNASPDRSLAVLDRFASLVPWLRVHRSAANVHHGPALDALLSRHATGEWALLLDADTVLLRDPLPALEPLLRDRPAFVGQIHPEPDHLYAYLCHLLVHRETVLGLPPFAEGGAPGAELFRAVSTRSLPWARFRFPDFVRHHGQASLRSVVRRGERQNPLFSFAAREASRAPSPPGRLALEAALASRVDAFLAGADAPLPVSSASLDEEVPPPPPRRERRRPLLGPSLRLLGALRPRRLVGRALAMDLPGDEASSLALLARLRRLAPRAVLDTGVFRGGSLLLHAATASLDARVLGIGEPPWELDDPGEAEKRVRLASYLLPTQRLRLARRRAEAPGLEQEAARALGGRRAEALLLHGGVDAEAAFPRLAPLLAPGALVAGPLSSPGFGAVLERAPAARRLPLGGTPRGWAAFLA